MDPLTSSQAPTNEHGVPAAPWLAMLLLISVLGIAYIPSAPAGLDAARLPKELALAALGGCSLICLAISSRRSLSFAEWLLIASCGATAFSALRATNGYLAFRASTITVSAVLVGIALRRANSWMRHAAIAVFVATGTVAASVALAEALHILPAMSLPSRGPGGVFLHRNAAAHFVTLAIPSSWWIERRLRHRGARVLVTLMATVMTTFILVSRCRGAWIGLIAIAALIVGSEVWRKRLRIRTCPSATIIWVGAIASGILLAVPLTKVVGYTESRPLVSTASRLLDVRSGSGRGRLQEMLHSIRMWQDAPLLGVGPGNWSVEYPRYAPVDDPSLLQGMLSVDSQPHSDYVGILTERGVLGGAMFAVALLLLLVTMRRRPTAADRVTVLSTLLAVLLMGIVDPIALTAAGLGAVLVVVASLVPVAGRATSTDTSGMRLFGERTAFVMGAAWTAVALLFLGRSVLAALYYGVPRDSQSVVRAAQVAPWDYRAYMLQAAALITNGRCDEARPPLERAHSLEPNWPAPDDLGAGCSPAIVVSVPRPASEHP